MHKILATPLQNLPLWKITIFRIIWTTLSLLHSSESAAGGQLWQHTGCEWSPTQCGHSLASLCHYIAEILSYTLPPSLQWVCSRRTALAAYREWVKSYTVWPPLPSLCHYIAEILSYTLSLLHFSEPAAGRQLWQHTGCEWSPTQCGHPLASLFSLSAPA